MAQNHRIAEIRGLDDAMRAKLTALGSRHAEDLLARAGNATGRGALAQELGVDRAQVTEWVNRADLMRLKGVGRQMSNLLEESGVDSCKDASSSINALLKSSPLCQISSKI